MPSLRSQRPCQRPCDGRLMSVPSENGVLDVFVASEAQQDNTRIWTNGYIYTHTYIHILGGPLDNYSLQELKAGFLHFRDPFSTFQSFIFHTSNSDFPRLKAHFSTF